MSVSRRELLRIASASAGLALAGRLGLACSSPDRPRLSEADATKVVATAVYGAELREAGLRRMKVVRLSSDEREQLAALIAVARSGRAIDGDVLEDHEDITVKLLRDYWLDQTRAWLGAGYSHAPGTCTLPDDYTRPLPAPSRPSA